MIDQILSFISFNGPEIGITLLVILLIVVVIFYRRQAGGDQSRG